MNRLRHLLHLLTASCEEIAELASQSLDREMPRLERFAIRLHLVYCSACRRYRRQLRLLRDASRRLASEWQNQLAADDAASPSLSPEARERLKRALDQ